MPSFNDPAIWLKELFLRVGLSFGLSAFLSTLALVFIVLFFSWLSKVIAKAVIRRIVSRIVERTTSTWDDIFLEQKVFTRLSHLAPALIIWAMAGWALKVYPTWQIFEHLIAIMNEFDLKVFQHPTGYDVISSSKIEIQNQLNN